MLAAVVCLPLFTSASGQGLADSGPQAGSEHTSVPGDRLDELAAAMADRAEVQAAVLMQDAEPPVLLDALPKDAEVEVSSPKGKRVWTASALADHDLPWAAKRAYVRAARNSARTDPGCHIPWTLLAAIGRVESNHGRYGGSELGTDGVTRPRILGLPLNGVGPVAAIHDTDGGRLDGDTVWDRAVGPMQFIPSTWAISGKDGDGDGTASPHDIDDAATAAASYLCAGGGDLREPAAQKAAIYRYNHSDYYVSLVRAFEAGYRTGDFSVPAPPEVQQKARTAKKKADARDAKKAKKDAKAKKRGGKKDAGKKSAKGDKAHTKPSATPGPTSSPTGRKPSPKASPSKSPSPSPSKSPTGKGSKSPSPSKSSGPSKGSPSPSPKAVEMTGLLRECDEGYCLAGKPLIVEEKDGHDPELIGQLLDALVGGSVTMRVVPEGQKLRLLEILS